MALTVKELNRLDRDKDRVKQLMAIFSNNLREQFAQGLTDTRDRRKKISFYQTVKILLAGIPMIPFLIISWIDDSNFRRICRMSRLDYEIAKFSRTFVTRWINVLIKHNDSSMWGEIDSETMLPPISNIREKFYEISSVSLDRQAVDELISNFALVIKNMVGRNLEGLVLLDRPNLSLKIKRYGSAYHVE